MMVHYQKVITRIEREATVARRWAETNNLLGREQLFTAAGFRDWKRIWRNAFFFGKGDAHEHGGGIEDGRDNGDGNAVDRGSHDINNNDKVTASSDLDLRQLEELQMRKHQLEQEILRLEGTSHHISAEVKSNADQLTELQLKIQQESAKLSQYGIDQHAVQRREDELWDRMKLLSDNIGKGSRREAIER